MFELPVVASLIVAVTVPAVPIATGRVSALDTIGGVLSPDVIVKLCATLAAAL